MESQPTFEEKCKAKNTYKSFLDLLSTTKEIIFFFNSDGFNPPQPPKQAFVTQPRAMPIFSQYLRESPCRVQCPSCQNTIVTIPQPKNGLAVYAIAAGLCFVGYVLYTQLGPDDSGK